MVCADMSRDLEMDGGGMGTMAKWVKSPPGTHISYIGRVVKVPATALPFQLLLMHLEGHQMMAQLPESLSLK